MAVTPETLKAKFEELTSVSSASLQKWIDEAELNVNRTAWGDRADDGVSYLSAHLYTYFGDTAAAGTAGAPGPLTSLRIDQISKSYAVGDIFQNDALGTTKYGRHYISLRSRIFAARCI